MLSRLAKTVLSTRFTKMLGGGSNKHRCWAPNPSITILHGHLPTSGELHHFEQTYVGVHTSELMERYSGWSSGTIKRNKTCLLCLKSTRRRDKSYLMCDTCPRTIHFDCLDQSAPHMWHKQTCPACCKRRWNIIRPLTPVQRHGQSDEDYYMQRVRRYHRWHRYNCQHVEEWQRLLDDGSLESDRRLLIEMGVTKRKPVSIPADNTNYGVQRGGHHSNESQVEIAQGLDRATTNTPGEAAGYFDPHTSRLGTDTGSARSNRSHIFATSHHSDNSQAVSADSQASGVNHHSRTESSRSASRESPVASHEPANAEHTRSLPDRKEQTTIPIPSIRSPASRSNANSTTSQHSDQSNALGNDHAHPSKAAPNASRGSSNSRVSSMPTDSMRSYRSDDSRSNTSHARYPAGRESTAISQASMGASSDTSRHIDQRSHTGKRPA